MATAFGITGWQPGAANAVALTAFTRWVEDRGISASAISTHAWKEIHAGANHNQAANTLADLGWLIPGEDRHITKKKRDS